MLLYHTGFEILKNPDVHFGRKNADFGQGFYLTPDQDFSCRWAKERKDRVAVINTYELDTEGLKVHSFTRQQDWFSYIFRNRRGQKDTLDADVIIGPIANDTIYDTLGMFTSGFLKDEEALELLLIGPEYIQVALKTEKAAGNLRWITSREIPTEEIAGYRETVQKEQDAYLTAISKKMSDGE